MRLNGISWWKQGWFPHTFTQHVNLYALLKINGSIQVKNISIDICSSIKKNHINVDLVNQLMVPKPNIIENDRALSDEKY